jgi:hypothetical protein
MQSKRNPDPRPPVATLDRIGAVAEITNLRRILAAERRRHSHLEEALSRYLQGIEEDRAGLREAYVKALTLYPGPAERKN